MFNLFLPTGIKSCRLGVEKIQLLPRMLLFCRVFGAEDVGERQELALRQRWQEQAQRLLQGGGRYASLLQQLRRKLQILNGSGNREKREKRWSGSPDGYLRRGNRNLRSLTRSQRERSLSSSVPSLESSTDWSLRFKTWNLETTLWNLSQKQKDLIPEKRNGWPTSQPSAWEPAHTCEAPPGGRTSLWRLSAAETLHLPHCVPLPQRPYGSTDLMGLQTHTTAEQAHPPAADVGPDRHKYTSFREKVHI